MDLLRRQQVVHPHCRARNGAGTRAQSVALPRTPHTPHTPTATQGPRRLLKGSSSTHRQGYSPQQCSGHHSRRRSRRRNRRHSHHHHQGGRHTTRMIRMRRCHTTLMPQTTGRLHRHGGGNVGNTHPCCPLSRPDDTPSPISATVCVLPSLLCHESLLSHGQAGSSIFLFPFCPLLPFFVIFY